MAADRVARFNNFIKRVKTDEELEDPNSVLDEFIATFTGHGLNKIYRRSSQIFRRVVWMVIVILFIAVGIYQCYLAIAEYLTFPKKVTLEVEEETIVQFPAVSVCNLNPLPKRDLLIDHPIWGAFVEVEASNLNPICDNLMSDTDYSEDSFCDYDHDAFDLGEAAYSDNVYDEGLETFNCNFDEEQFTINISAVDVGYRGQPKLRRDKRDLSKKDDVQKKSGAKEDENESRNKYENAHLKMRKPQTINQSKRKKTQETPNQSNSKQSDTRKNQRRMKRDFNRDNLEEYQEEISELYDRLKWQSLPGNGYDRMAFWEHLYSSLGTGREFPWDSVMDISQFIRINEPLYLVKNVTRLNRSKRQAQQSGKMRMRMTNDMKKKRIACSKFYPYIGLLLQQGVSSTEANDAMSKGSASCPIRNFNESVTFNPACNLAIFCDNLGCYDERLFQFFEQEKIDPDTGEKIRCPSCENFCYYNDMLNDWEEGQLDPYHVEKMFSNSRTKDMMDVLGIYIPSRESIKDFSMKAEDFIQSCSFDSRPCSFRDFLTWTSDQHGKCFTFNSKYLQDDQTDPAMIRRTKVRKTSAIGPKYGLRLTLDIEAGQYLALLSPEIGARVMIHPPDLLPFPEDEGFNVSPQEITSISIRKKRIIRVDEPHGKCEKNLKESTKAKYTKLLCRKLCLETAFRDRCGCYLGMSPVYTYLLPRHNLKQCTPFNAKQKFCLERTLMDFQVQIGNLSCSHCEPACMETNYMPQVTSTKANPKFYTIIQNLKRVLAGDDICDSKNMDTVRLHVYLESLSHEVIEETEAITFNTLVGNVGGHLGLFIGMSLITFVEIFEFFVDIFVILFKRKKKNNNNVSKTDVEKITPAVNTVSAGIASKPPDKPIKKMEDFPKSAVSIPPSKPNTAFSKPMNTAGNVSTNINPSKPNTAFSTPMSTGGTGGNFSTNTNTPEVSSIFSSDFDEDDLSIIEDNRGTPDNTATKEEKGEAFDLLFMDL